MRLRSLLTGLVVIGAVLAAAGASVVLQSRAQALDSTNPIPYVIADGDARSGFRSTDRQLAQWALDAWARNAGSSLGFVAAAESQALVRLYWAEPSDGQYGEMRSLMVGGRRGAAVYIRPDMDSLGPQI